MNLLAANKQQGAGYSGVLRDKERERERLIFWEVQPAQVAWDTWRRTSPHIAVCPHTAICVSSYLQPLQLASDIAFHCGDKELNLYAANQPSMLLTKPLAAGTTSVGHRVPLRRRRKVLEWRQYGVYGRGRRGGGG
jgi:hypothetical protein